MDGTNKFVLSSIGQERFGKTFTWLLGPSEPCGSTVPPAFAALGVGGAFARFRSGATFAETARDGEWPGGEWPSLRQRAPSTDEAASECDEMEATPLAHYRASLLRVAAAMLLAIAILHTDHWLGVAGSVAGSVGLTLGDQIAARLTPGLLRRLGLASLSAGRLKRDPEPGWSALKIGARVIAVIGFCAVVVYTNALVGAFLHVPALVDEIDALCLEVSHSSVCTELRLRSPRVLLACATRGRTTGCST